MEPTILEFTSRLRRTFGRYPEMSGGCMKFFLLLQATFPQAEGYYNSHHVIAKVDGWYYDLDGKVADPSDYLTFREFGFNNLRKQFSSFLSETEIEQMSECCKPRRRKPRRHEPL